MRVTMDDVSVWRVGDGTEVWLVGAYDESDAVDVLCDTLGFEQTGEWDFDVERVPDEERIELTFDNEFRVPDHLQSIAADRGDGLYSIYATANVFRDIYGRALMGSTLW